jgi:NAD(P)H-hydrate epimerase
VLTGFLAALLAQGMTPRTAAALGVFLHGVAGEYAAKEKTSYCMIASDILEHFSSAFNYLY